MLLMADMIRPSSRKSTQTEWLAEKTRPSMPALSSSTPLISRGRRVLSSSQPVTGSRRMEKRPAADMMNDSSWADFPWPARYTASTELNTAMLK